MCGKLRAALRGISAYKNITAAPPMETATALLDALSLGDGDGALRCYTDLFYSLHSEGYAGLGDWLWDMLRYGQSPYSEALETGGAGAALEAAARQDVETFRALSMLDCGDIIAAMANLLPEEYASILKTLPRWETGAPFTFDTLKQWYAKWGAGVFAYCRAFLCEEGELICVPDPDCPARLIGYEWQRAEVMGNTRALMQGRQVNNVLLYGDSGTGKSATVKALLDVPEFHDLRLIEVEKNRLTDLPRLIRQLRGRRYKFILFIDDLTFDQDDRNYSVLKSLLEGGLEKRPDNVAIYATSNRRHLIRQTFSDRAGDDIDRTETIQERTSLAERFGVRVPYLAMNKQEFLKLVEELAALGGVCMERDALRAEAIKWETSHPGRTPRTAQQFILSLG